VDDDDPLVAKFGIEVDSEQIYRHPANNHRISLPTGVTVRVRGDGFLALCRRQCSKAYRCRRRLGVVVSTMSLPSRPGIERQEAAVDQTCPSQQPSGGHMRWNSAAALITGRDRAHRTRGGRLRLAGQPWMPSSARAASTTEFMLITRVKMQTNPIFANTSSILPRWALVTIWPARNQNTERGPGGFAHGCVPEATSIRYFDC
jgi:hypothetical protein